VSGGNIVVSNVASKTFEIGLNKVVAVESHGQTLTGTAASGQVWAVNVKVGASTIATASVVAGGTDKTVIAAALVNQLNLVTTGFTSAGYKAAAAGDTVIVSKASSAASSFSVNVATAHAADVTATTGFDVLTLSGTPADGDYWAVQLVD